MNERNVFERHWPFKKSQPQKEIRFVKTQSHLEPPAFVPLTTEEISAQEAWLEKIRLWNEENDKNPKGHLGMTDKDHEILGSTIPERLAQNPGKTEAELMSDEEIFNYLLDLQKQIKEWSKPESLKTDTTGSFIKSFQKRLEGDLAYLKELVVCPKSLIIELYPIALILIEQ